MYLKILVLIALYFSSYKYVTFSDNQEEEEENLFVNQINTVQNVSEETNDWLPKRASLSSWSPNQLPYTL